MGLFRTEFMFQSRDYFPTEEEQFQVYQRMALALQGKPLTIRTLDAGGDKPLPYLTRSPEEIPELGCRGVRFCWRRWGCSAPSCGRCCGPGPMGTSG